MVHDPVAATERLPRTGRDTMDEFNSIDADRGEDPCESAADSQGTARPGVLLFVCLLVMPNLYLFYSLNTRMDLYGFFTLEPVSAPPLPLVLSILLSTGMAVAGYGFYRWLWRRQAWFTGGGWGPFSRGAVLMFAPVLLTYAPMIVLAHNGDKPSLIGIPGLMAGSLCVTHALRDPEIKLDPSLARYLFIGTIAWILVALILTIGAMFMLYVVEKAPPSGNLIWTWEYEWADLGYPPEEYQQHRRSALLGFVLTGSGFLIVVVGGSMLGAIMRWTRAPQDDARSPPSQRYLDAPVWVELVALQLESVPPLGSEDVDYVAVFSGYEIRITRRQYERLVADKDDLLQDFRLLVDRVAGDVFLKTGGTWTRQDFRVRDTSTGIRSGPFALLSIYARHPGRRFTNGELRAMVSQDLTDRLSVNVGDFISQLRRRRPRLPVEQDDDTSFLPESVRVCLLDQGQ